MKTEKKLTIGEHCFVHRPNETFSGMVMDLQKDQVRVAGGMPDVHYDEWFPITSKCLHVEPA